MSISFRYVLDSAMVDLPRHGGNAVGAGKGSPDAAEFAVSVSYHGLG